MRTWLLLSVVLLSACSSKVPDPLAPWAVVVESTADSPITIEETDHDLRIRFKRTEYRSGIRTTTKETITVKKESICGKKRGLVGGVIGSIGEFIGGILLGLFL